MNPKSVVVSYSIEEQAFRQERLKEYTQGNALRILKGHAPAYAAIAVVETQEEADRAIAAFARQQRVARGEELPFIAAPRVSVPTTISAPI